jgi:hypothetical protein
VDYKQDPQEYCGMMITDNPAIDWLTRIVKILFSRECVWGAFIFLFFRVA